MLYSADGETLLFCPQGRTGTAEIPEGVREIGDYAFCRCGITDVVFPDTLEKISGRAFMECMELTSVTMPDSLREIGDSAFIHSGLKEITLNEGLLSIGDTAFDSTEITELYLPDSVEKTGRLIGGAREFSVSAQKFTEGLLPLEKSYYNTSYRGETYLERAIRLGMRQDVNDGGIRVFTDVNGDNFPEMIMTYKVGNEHSMNWIYTYSDESGWGGMSYTDAAVTVCYDEEDDGYFYVISGYDNGESSYLFANKFYYNENDFWDCDYYGGIGVRRWVDGEDDKDIGCLNYIEGGGEFRTVYCGNEAEYDGKAADFKEMIEKSLEKNYKVVSSVNINERLNELLKGYSPEDGNVFVDSDPGVEPSGPALKPAEKESAIVEIGKQSYGKSAYVVNLYNSDITPENFAKLTRLPNLTSLFLNAHDVDLTGIEKLTGLKRLDVMAYNSVTGTEKLTALKELEWLEIRNSENIDFLSDMDSVKVLDIYGLEKMPDDHLKPLCGMDGLEFIITVRDYGPTDKQKAYIKANRPDVRFAYSYY